MLVKSSGGNAGQKDLSTQFSLLQFYLAREGVFTEVKRRMAYRSEATIRKASEEKKKNYYRRLHESKLEQDGYSVKHKRRKKV